MSGFWETEVLTLLDVISEWTTPRAAGESRVLRGRKVPMNAARPDLAAGAGSTVCSPASSPEGADLTAVTRSQARAGVLLGSPGWRENWSPSRPPASAGRQRSDKLTFAAMPGR